jgi:hypothetical protein
MAVNSSLPASQSDDLADVKRCSSDREFCCMHSGLVFVLDEDGNHRLWSSTLEADTEAIEQDRGLIRRSLLTGRKVARRLLGGKHKR